MEILLGIWLAGTVVTALVVGATFMRRNKDEMSEYSPLTIGVTIALGPILLPYAMIVIVRRIIRGEL
jgi:hypothetical protein